MTIDPTEAQIALRNTKIQELQAELSEQREQLSEALRHEDEYRNHAAAVLSDLAAWAERDAQRAKDWNTERDNIDPPFHSLRPPPAAMPITVDVLLQCDVGLEVTVIATPSEAKAAAAVMIESLDLVEALQRYPSNGTEVTNIFSAEVREAL